MIKQSPTVVLSPLPVPTSSLQGHPEVKLMPDYLVWTIWSTTAHLFAAWKQSFSSTKTSVAPIATSRGAWSSGFSTNSLGLDGSKAKTLVSHRNFLIPNTSTPKKKHRKQSTMKNKHPLTTFPLNAVSPFVGGPDLDFQPARYSQELR